MTLPIRRLFILTLATAAACGGLGTPTPLTPGVLLAQVPPEEGTADYATTDAVPLGPAFENALTGISVRPPMGSKKIERAGNTDEIVQFVDDKRNWTLRVSRLRFSKPIVLTDPGANKGLLELSLEKLKEAGTAEVLRSEVTNVGSRGVPDTGLLAVRYQLDTKRPRLAQQALIQFSETLYYVVELDSPGSKPGTGAAEASNAEKTAVATFTAVVDSVKLLDRQDVREAQNQRLFATRALYVNLTEDRLRKAITPERWIRLIQDGKDVGYSYVVEEEAERGGRKGVLIGVRSRTVPGEGQQVDAESFMFTSADRRMEEWSNIAKFTVDGKTRSSTEVGASSLSVRRQLVKGERPGEGKDENQPAVRETDDYRLTVTYSARGTPTEVSLPPWYLPQAMGHLLPRIVPLNEPKKYMFASYINEQRAVMMRYVDVLAEKDVEIGGKKYRAVPVSDRVGIEGVPTIHYMTKSGDYLGSVNETAKIVVLPTDAATLERLWTNADLSRPKPPAGPIRLELPPAGGMRGEDPGTSPRGPR